jgi:hypothetical protein
MAIDRLAPPLTVLNIPDRVARDQPGRNNVPVVPQPPGDADGATFVPGAGTPAAVGALLEAIDGQPLVNAAPAALAGKAALDALLSEPAMQPNQLFMSRQVVWHPPDPSALAASWMVMVRNYAEQRAALMQQTEGRHLPAGLFLSDQAPAVLRDGRVPPHIVAETDAWRFAVYAWGSEKLVLRVVVRDDDDEESAAPAHAPRIALRLEVFLPNMGKVVVQMEPMAHGVLLEIGAAQNAAMQHMRTLLPQIAALANRCGVTIVRARLTRELGGVSANQPTGRQVGALSPAVFHTMAEVAVLLSQPLPPDELFLQEKPEHA